MKDISYIYSHLLTKIKWHQTTHDNMAGMLPKWHD